MTTPNLNPDDVPDHDDAANSAPLSDLQGANASDTLRGQMTGMTGPSGLIGSLIMGALGNVVDDMQGVQQPGKRKKSLANASAYADGVAGGASPSVPRPLQQVINGIFNGWFGGGGVGDPQQVQYTIEAIADAIINGYNVETKVTSGTWTKPDTISELVVIGIGGGRSGGGGGTDIGGQGGAGGGGGGFIAQTLDPADIPASVSYSIGAAGQASTFGSFLSVDGGSGGIASDFGFTPTTSAPGNGGDGGKGNVGSNTTPTAGEDGTASALGVAGIGGSHGGGLGSGQPGTPGGNVSAATRTKCGGGGGGGGGGSGTAATAQTRYGGAGGPGGYPGGGGGGGGGRGGQGTGGNSNAGAGGIGATGILWIFWR